jgi:hypothetical protein
MCSTLMFGTLKLGLIDLQSAPPRYVCQLMEVTCNECTLYTAVGGGKLEWECNCVYEKVHNVHSFIN